MENQPIVPWSRRLFTGLLIALCLALGAGPARAQRPVNYPLQSQAKRYHLEGTVIALRPMARQLVVDAKPIAGYMSAMAMPFPVRDTAVFSQLRPGDQISADIVVQSGASWLENVTREGNPASTGAGPLVDTTVSGRRDSARPPKDSIGIKPPPVDSFSRPTP